MSIDKKKFVPNSFQLANAFVDDAMEHLSGNAVKIYLVVVRKTRGWQKETDKISLSQFEAYTGLARHTTIKAVRELVAIGLLIETKGGKSTNQYSLNDDVLAAEITVTASANASASSSANASAENAPMKNASADFALDQCKNYTRSSAENAPIASADFAHTKDNLLNTKKQSFKTSEKDSFFEDQKPVNASTLGCERQTESVKTDDRICAFSGLELLTFKKILAVYPNATQQAVRSNAEYNGMDVLRYMQKFLEQAA